MSTWLWHMLGVGNLGNYKLAPLSLKYQMGVMGYIKMDLSSWNNNTIHTIKNFTATRFFMLIERNESDSEEDQILNFVSDEFEHFWALLSYEILYRQSSPNKLNTILSENIEHYEKEVLRRPVISWIILN